MNLPTTSLPIRPDPWTTDQIIEQANKIYQLQSESRQGSPKFILHDGPPYANGSLHTGHFVNKTLKDFVNRYKLMTGHHIKYVPGWDCHGLPIELKVLEAEKKSRNDLGPQVIREKATAFAKQNVQQQMRSFQSWGIMGEWDKPYLTLQKEYEARQIQVFKELLKKEYVYRGFKPVYWSPSTGTALAESELEYNDKHTSPSIYVAFPVTKLGPQATELSKYENLSAVIWTTTPWTIPSNLAISVNPTVEYSIVKVENEAKHFILASDLVETFSKQIEKIFQVQTKIMGDALTGSEYKHPLAGRSSPIITGDHVTTASGTGLVHTAPGHGFDDFLVCKKHGIQQILCPVDDAGKFTAEAGPFAGLEVMKGGNKAVIAALQETGCLVKSEKYVHKYPYDWRSKEPIIIRVTQQWFCSLKDIQGSAVKELSNVTFYPASGLSTLSSMVTGRSDWCISRQRSWGVPIPVFYNKSTGEALATPESIDYVQSLIAKHGADCWWNMPTEELLAPQYRNNGNEYEKGKDTMDVWFDSGVSWNSVLNERGMPFPADMYLEGIDQHRGWFQSSLLTSVAVTGKAPYKSVVTHGFVLDEKGRKMSKSLGNIIEPQVIIQGGADRKKEPAYGLDVLRSWVGLASYFKDIEIGPSILEKVVESLRKIRNTVRFAMAANYDLKQEDLVPYDQLREMDKYMLHKLNKLITDVTNSFDELVFSKAMHIILDFCIVDLSTFYYYSVKDSLYADAPNNINRRSAQTVLYHIQNTLIQLIAPITFTTSEDLYKHSILFKEKLPSVLYTGWPKVESTWTQEQLNEKWKVLRNVRNEANKKIEGLRKSAQLGTGIETQLFLYIENKELFNIVNSLPAIQLEDLFVVSKITLEHPSKAIEELGEATLCSIKMNDEFINFHMIAKVADKFKCPRCWKFQSDKQDCVCKRCETVLQQ